MKFRKAIILSVLAVFGIVGVLAESSLAWETKKWEVKVFSATADHSTGLEAATNSVNAQIADFLEKGGVDIVSTSMFTSANGSVGVWKLFITVSITCKR